MKPWGSLGFIGAGQMGRALAQGVVRARLVKPADCRVVDPSPAAVASFLSLLPAAQVAADARQLVAESELVVVAVKPQHFDSVVDALGPAFPPEKLLISVVAGVTLPRMEQQLGTGRLIRVMPNTPCLIGCGASAFSCGRDATTDDASRVQALLSALGFAVALPEAMLDAVTGLSGSGPAYAYTMIEALSDGGVLMGLPRAVATQLAAHTLSGAAQMVLSQGEHPAVLKDQVASPGGTTMAGCAALEQAGFRGTVIRAVQSATARARELAQQ